MTVIMGDIATMKYVGWMYNEDTGASGSAVEDDNGNTVAWFENADDAIAYAKMPDEINTLRAQLQDACSRAEAAEVKLAAVPVDAIDSLVESCERANAQEARWCDTITNWLQSFRQ